MLDPLRRTTDVPSASRSAAAIAAKPSMYEASRSAAAPSAARLARLRLRDQYHQLRPSHRRAQSLRNRQCLPSPRQLFSIRQQLITEFRCSAKIETPRTERTSVIPAHPGAAAFVDGEGKPSRSLLDYYLVSLMAFSRCPAARVRGHLKKDERSTQFAARTPA